MQKRRGWVWLAIIAVAVAAVPSSETGSTTRRIYGPILNLLAAHTEAWPGSHAAVAVSRTRSARGSAAGMASRSKRFDSEQFRHMLVSEFVGLVSPLTPVTASSILAQQWPPSELARAPQFQRPPPAA